MSLHLPLLSDPDAILNKRAVRLVALLCGAAFPLGFAPFSWYLIPVVSLAVFAWLLYRVESSAAFSAGWLFGMGQFGVGVSWVFVSIYQYGSAGLLLSLLVTFLSIAFLALFPASMAWLLVKIRPALSSTWFFLALFPAVWTLFEWIRSWILTGFPWLNLGYTQMESPLLGFAAILGVYGVGWFAAVSAGLLVVVFTRPARIRWLAVFVAATIWISAAVLDGLRWTQVAGEPLQATIVQGNIPQALKWKPQQQKATLDRYVELSQKHLDSDLIVWPETAIPAFYDQMVDDFLIPLQEQMKENGVSLVTGIPVLDRSSWNNYNAVISLDEPGTFYYKVHLVPFGEYLPLREWMENVLDFLPVPGADFSSGQLDQPLLIAAGYPVGASICYEIAFGEQLASALPEAAFLINVSNDAWFGDSLAAHQHLEMARMRARETERYVLRATNTGISAIIKEDGGWAVRSQQFTRETITAQVFPRSGATPYVRWGNGPVIVICILLVIAAVWLPGVARK